MLFGIELTDLIRTIGVIGIMAIVFAESGLLIGFFLPGDTLLFTAGFLANQGVLGIDVSILALLLFIAAVTGDSVGYAFGKRMGPRVFKKQDSILFHQDNIRRAEAFYNKYGPITIMLARFVPVVRTFAPVVAGVGNMHYRTFLMYNVIGGLLWAVGLTYVGFFAGAWFEANHIEIDHFILPIIGIVTLLTLISPVVHIMQNKDSRDRLIAKFKKNPQG